MALGFQRGGLFGRRASGLVATPEQQAESDRLEQIFGAQGRVPVDAKPMGFPAGGPFGTPALPDMGGPGLGHEPKKPGFFGQGGVGRGIAGSIGDFLLQQNDMRPIYAPQVQQLQQQAAQLAADQRNRSLDMQDWQAKQQWELDHPKPANNDTLNDMAAAANWTPEQWATYDKLHPVYRVGPDGIPYPMARGGATPPTAPVGRLTPIDGGPTQPASGTFR